MRGNILGDHLFVDLLDFGHHWARAIPDGFSVDLRHRCLRAECSGQESLRGTIGLKERVIPFKDRNTDPSAGIDHLLPRHAVHAVITCRGPNLASSHNEEVAGIGRIHKTIRVKHQRFIRTGGNTSCVELQSGGARLILDGGTGLAALGQSLGPKPLTATLLFTHVHWDHIQGVPFFQPAFHPESRLTLGGATTSAGTLEDALRAQMRPPQFPITLEALAAQIDFLPVERGESFQKGPFTVFPEVGHHPDGVISYRVEADGQSVVFATDVEHAGSPPDSLLDLSTDTDLLIHDAQFTPQEYAGEVGPSRQGWGHSTWPEAVQVARASGAKRLALFHHDPGRDDEALAVLERQARREFSGAFAAREGSWLTL